MGNNTELTSNCWRDFASQHAILYNNGKSQTFLDVRSEAGETCAVDWGIHSCVIDDITLNASLFQALR